MLLQIGAKPESDFSEPLGMLSDCHKRIQHFLRDLTRLAETAVDTKLEPADRASLQRALQYFRESGPRHTADEEESLFPRLRSMKDDRAAAALAKVDELEADHERANEGHRLVDAIGTDWLASGILSAEKRARLTAEMKRLAELYEHHIAVEDNEVFPAASRLISAQDKAVIGREMAVRRGLSPEIVERPDPSGDAPQAASGVVRR